MLLDSYAAAVILLLSIHSTLASCVVRTVYEWRRPSSRSLWAIRFSFFRFCDVKVSDSDLKAQLSAAYHNGFECQCLYHRWNSVKFPNTMHLRNEGGWELLRRKRLFSFRGSIDCIDLPNMTRKINCNRSNSIFIVAHQKNDYPLNKLNK